MLCAQSQPHGLQFCLWLFDQLKIIPWDNPELILCLWACANGRNPQTTTRWLKTSNIQASHPAEGVCVCVCVCVCVKERRKIELTVWGKKVPIALDGIRTCISGIRAHSASDCTTTAGTSRVSRMKHFRHSPVSSIAKQSCMKDCVCVCVRVCAYVCVRACVRVCVCHFKCTLIHHQFVYLSLPLLDYAYCLYWWDCLPHECCSTPKLFFFNFVKGTPNSLSLVTCAETLSKWFDCWSWVFLLQ